MVTPHPPGGGGVEQLRLIEYFQNKVIQVEHFFIRREGKGAMREKKF